MNSLISPRTAAIAAAVALCAALAVQVALAGPAPAATEPRPSLASIEEQVMCTVCGVPLSMAREAPAAKRQRAFIQGLIAAGLSEKQIKDRLVVEYGKGVLVEPGRTGFDLAAWLVPAAALIAAVVLLAMLLLRWRRNPTGAAADRAPTPAPLSPSDSELVDEALRERS